MNTLINNPLVQKLHESVWPAAQNSQLPAFMPMTNGLEPNRENLDGIRRALIRLMTSNLNDLRGTAEHYPLSDDQLQEVQKDILEMNARADELAQLLVAAFGEADQRAIRAKEIDAAFQRLQWAMQGSKAAKAS